MKNAPCLSLLLTFLAVVWWGEHALDDTRIRSSSLEALHLVLPVRDEHFPDHPLARCRAHLRMLEDRISLKAGFKTACPFAEPT